MNARPVNLLQDNSHLRAMLLDRIQLVRHNEDEMRRLDAAGRIYATPHYRDGKYLYLLHPSDTPNQRGRREYAGANPTLVKAALAKIQNGRSYDEIKAQNRKITNALNVAAYHMSAIINELKRVAPVDLATQGNGEIGDMEDLPGGDSVTNPAGVIKSALVTDPAIEQLRLSPI